MEDFQANGPEQPGKYRPPAKPLPARTHQALMDARKNSKLISLHDRIETLHQVSWVDNVAYGDFLDAIYNEQAVEGSIVADDYEAARIIRDLAKSEAHRDEYVASQKLATIVKSLRVVWRRYDIGRDQRRGDSPANGE